MSARVYPAAPPALPPERRARIEGLAVVERSPADLAYLEAYDLAAAYPDRVADILEGLAAGLRAGRAEG